MELQKELFEALIGRRGAEENETNITDLPGVVVGSILSRISSPIDVASALKASRIFWGVAHSAPFRLKLRPSRLGYDALKVATWTRKALHGITRNMGCTEELDLAGCPVLDEDIAAVLVDLPCLEHLVLDGCQKLTSSVADVLAISVRSGPRVLSLQRCFRLGPAGAGNLLAAAAAGGARLQTLLLSHLDSLDLPRDPPVLQTLEDGTEKEVSEYVELVKSIGSRVPGTGLRILALHNCGGLGASQLAALAETCPHLEILMLGGSGEGLGLSRCDRPPQEKISIATTALLTVTHRLSRLRILEITFFTNSVFVELRAQLQSGILVWDFCDKRSVVEAARLVATLSSTCPDGGAPLGESQESPIPDWGIDFLCEHFNPELAHHAQLAEKWTELLKQRHDGYSTYIGGSWDMPAEDILLALKAGTNCSDIRRRTPLHVAAACGDADVTAKLLSIGASARNMKDLKGATALFIAAESGHSQVCDLILKGGADVLLSNSNGETPLYISALKGHADTVEVMLAHCQQRGVNWQDADIYGDGWTPLMAATVADRQDVADVLLKFALASVKMPVDAEVSRLELTLRQEDTFTDEAARGSNDSCALQIRVSNQSIVPRRPPTAPIVDAQNRYGQAALHIAARKGSMWFVEHLLSVGASLDVKDEYGLRPIDVARKFQHFTVEETLKKWQDVLAKFRVASTSGKSTRTRKSKQKKEAAAARMKTCADALAAEAAAAAEDGKLREDADTIETIILQLNEGALSSVYPPHDR